MLFEVARRLGLEEDILSVKRYLSEVQKNWLLIFDNADDPSIGLSKYFPTGGKGSILINGRNTELALYATVGSTDIGSLSSEAAIDLLLTAAGEAVNSSTATIESARSIVDALAYLPLALVYAGAYIKQDRCRLEEFMKEYNARSWQLLQHSPPRNWTNHRNRYDSVFKTFDLGFQKLEGTDTEASHDALDVLCFLSFVSCDVNAEELLEKAWSNEMKHARSSNSQHYQLRVLCNPMSLEWQPFRLRRALDLLASFSLIRLEQGGKIISTHRLVQTAVLERLNKDKLLRYSNVTASTLTAAAGMDLEAEEYGFREALLSHLSVFLSQHDDYLPGDIGVVDWAESLSSFSAAFRDGGQYERALKLETRAME